MGWPHFWDIPCRHAAIYMPFMAYSPPSLPRTRPIFLTFRRSKIHCFKIDLTRKKRISCRLEIRQHSTSPVEDAVLWWWFTLGRSLDTRRSAPRPRVHRPRERLHQSAMTAKTEGVFLCVRGGAELWGWNPQNANGMHSNPVSERALADVGLMSPQSSNIPRQVSFYDKRDLGMDQKEERLTAALWRALSSIDCSFSFDGVTRPWTWKREGGGMRYRSLSTRNSFSRRERIQFFLPDKRRNGLLFFSIAPRFIYFSSCFTVDLGLCRAARVIDHVGGIEKRQGGRWTK